MKCKTITAEAMYYTFSTVNQSDLIEYTTDWGTEPQFLMFHTDPGKVYTRIEGELRVIVPDRVPAVIKVYDISEGWVSLDSLWCEDERWSTFDFNVGNRSVSMIGTQTVTDNNGVDFRKGKLYYK